MKYSIIRSLCTLTVGVLLVVMRENAAGILVSCLGILFLLSGAATLSIYYIHRSKQQTTGDNYFPLVTGIGSLLLGLWLFITPTFFVNILMFLLGIVLAFMGLYQIILLLMAKKNAIVPFSFFVIPVLVFLAGIFVLFNPLTAASIPFLIVGIGAILYSISDLVNSFKFRRGRVEVIEEPQK